ncbi:MC128R [Molluscum contagiosum virus subtype 1]|uniref:Intermediate transcription factor 3 large subunit n=3 Tax=Molluscum contagiosum virus TaxID=10279 RepID=A0A7G5AXC9_MCV1|nr:MC128R [Molluscum contagiosum virus subtype 1]AZT86247.1 MC128R [Molluscum contagiosum virus]AAC55256.1 MC128R [Molluscum contagiosum virus subtype 1]AQY16877.1 MC128 [Molluscum contagiosum virus subtype 1]AQY17056.1 MC128 [Molluscum contagiosum virus subtype 1]AQY17235.1 MC128 [Molluscum contagiosum virus subtype 1]
MEPLLRYLHSVEDRYVRTIFNFHIRHVPDVPAIYEPIKARIAGTQLFHEVVPDVHARAGIKKFIYCDIHMTKHILNHAAYAQGAADAGRAHKMAQHFDVVLAPGADSARTRDIFLRDKSSLLSYIKTTSKKSKIDYGEIKKTIHCAGGGAAGYYSGRRSDEYLSTTVCVDSARPWIKSVSKRLRVDIARHAIVTRGKSSILQTIEVIYVNRTCVKIFKDSTVHVILSKDKAERRCVDLVDRLFGTYRALFALLHALTQHAPFRAHAAAADAVLAAPGFDEKLALIRAHAHMYGVHNFRVGMFNLTYTPHIAFTVFPSLLDHKSKIKFFKGKKLNIVALSSLQECAYYVGCAEALLRTMQLRSERLDATDVLAASVEELKELLL